MEEWDAVVYVTMEESVCVCVGGRGGEYYGGDCVGERVCVEEERVGWRVCVEEEGP